MVSLRAGSLVRMESLDRELARRMGRGKVTLFLALPTLFLASPVLGTSEPARRLKKMLRILQTCYATRDRMFKLKSMLKLKAKA